MIVYVFMLAISILFLVLAQKTEKKKQKILYYVLAGLPFFIVSAFRYNVGTDYVRRYTYDFSTMVKGGEINNLEIGFKLLLKLIILFTNNPLPVFVISSAIIVGLVMATIFTKSKNEIISLLIFFIGGFFFDSLNIMRQYIAVSIILFAYRFLLVKKQKIFYIIAVLLASTFHSTSLIMLGLLFLDKKMIANIKFVLPAAAFILLLNTRLFDIIGFFIQNTRFNVYLTGKLSVGDVSIVLIIENILLYLGMYYIYRKNEKKNLIEKEDILFLNIEAITLLVVVLGSVHILFLRIAFYFSIFQVLSLPYFIEKLQVGELIEDLKNISKNKIGLTKIKAKLKIDLTKIESKVKIIITVVVICMFTFHFVRTYIIKDTNEVTPYRSVFAKDIEIP